MQKFNHESGQIFEIDGAKIYCEIVGKQEGPPLLMLHGGIGNIEDFNEIIPSLAKNFKVIGIDSRGQGKSTIGSSKLTYERIEKDILLVLQKLNIDKLSIIGFSDGGIVAYRLAASGAINIEKLITIGSEWQLRDDDPVIPIFKKITANSWREKFPETYDLYQQQNPEPDFDKLVTAIVTMWLDRSETGYPADSVKNISSPLLIIRGDEDHLVTLQSLVDLRGMVTDAKFLNLPFASHVTFADQKDIVMGTIRQFLLKENQID
jgi:pimeloyl-ACP methyl ester carboxylesterase